MGSRVAVPVPQALEESCERYERQLSALSGTAQVSRVEPHPHYWCAGCQLWAVSYSLFCARGVSTGAQRDGAAAAGGAGGPREGGLRARGDHQGADGGAG